MASIGEPRRRLILTYIVSIDGKSVDDGVNDLRDVMNALDDPEQDQAGVDQLWEAGAILMGRTSYQMMAGFWPTSNLPSAGPMNQIEKVVFSRTPVDVDGWPQTRIAAGDTAEEIAKLKAEPGKDLFAIAGNAFQSALVALGVVDEYRLWVLPAAAGKGAPLFPPLDDPLRLRLLSSRVFSSGVLELRYIPAAT